MRTLITIAIVAIASGTTRADDVGDKQTDVGRAIDRGLSFLVKDALAWKSEHNCSSCHHAALVIWSMHEARQRGHVVDQPFLADFTRWVAESGDGRTGVPRPEGRPKALNVKAVLYALALAADPAPDAATEAGMKRFVETVKSDQVENGSWVAWPETRPPIFGGSDDSMTALATLALLPAAASGDADALVADKGVRWLAEQKTDDDSQSVAMRLVLWRRLDRPMDECQSLAQRIQDRQNADGGWSQAAGMESDAWATGQALYALAHTGMRHDERVLMRGRDFLVKSQREDGSWPMTSRPTRPGGAGSSSLIPITGGGSAWAVLGLVRSESPDRTLPAR